MLGYTWGRRIGGDCLVTAFERGISTTVGLRRAYHFANNIPSCLGCVTDWQQETRGLFLWSRAVGTLHQVYRRWRASSARRSKHFRRAHLKVSSLGIAKCPHLPHIYRPSATSTIGINSSPEVQ